MKNISLCNLLQMPPESAQFQHILALLLNRVPPGGFNDEGNNAMRAKWPTPTCELVSIRAVPLKYETMFEVLLSKRPTNEDANEWHFGGGVWLTDENTYEQPAERIVKREFGDAPFAFKPIGYLPARDEHGTIVCCINLVVWANDPAPEYGQWFDVEHLPEPMVPHHREVIKIAVEWYRRNLK